MLVPLTASLYVPGSLDDAEKVLVDVGTGYFIEVTWLAVVVYTLTYILVQLGNLYRLLCGFEPLKLLRLYQKHR